MRILDKLIARLRGKGGGAVDTLTYVVLGGSLSLGYNDWFGGGFVKRYAKHVQEDNPGVSVEIKNFSNPSTPSKEMLEIVQRSEVQAALAQAQIISLDNGAREWVEAREAYKAGRCGGGDGQDCLREMYDIHTSNRRRITEIIESLRRPEALVFTSHYANPFTRDDIGVYSHAGELDDFRVISSYLRDLNRFVGSDAEEKGWRFIDLNLLFNGPTFDADMVALEYVTRVDRKHFTKKGHLEWAAAMRSLGYAPLLSGG